MTVYVGARYQRGHGLGSIFRTIARIAMPVLRRTGKSALKAMGREVARSGSNFVSDVIGGVPIKEAAKSRSQQGLKNVLRAGQQAVIGATGLVPGQVGSGYGGKRKAQQRRGGPKPKRKTHDIFH